MNIKLEITDQDKGQMASLLTECHVLRNLLNERQAALENKAKEIVIANGLSTNLYALKFNPGKDLWEAVLKRGELVLPKHGVVPGKISPS